ncbi:MAG TPA: hypothetical protein VFJ14_05700 [Nocardioidaceae bacterium]|nr:hypothetical protein [Nocardioidaceae bacterium]
MKLHSYEYRDPGAVIAEVAERVPLTEDSAYLVLVADPSTEQRIVTVQRFDEPALLDDWDDARREIHRRVSNLPIPREEEPQHSMLTVLVRAGLCVFGPQESPWFNAWKYSNHLRRVFGSEFILVTEHGWRHFMTDCAGRQPALVTPPVHV